MTISSNSFRIALCVSALSLSTPLIAQTKDHAPVALKSASKMAQDAPGSESWTYAKPRNDFLKYRTVIIEPTQVYNGPDAQFDGIPYADRQRFADIVTQELRAEVVKAFPSPAQAQADTLKLRVTILGARKTKGGLATATRVTPLGFGTSALKSALGKTGSLTGSLLFAVELYDGRTNELMLAAVRRRTPDPLDIPATLSTTDTVKAIAREFGDGARKRLEDLTQIPH